MSDQRQAHANTGPVWLPAEQCYLYPNGARFRYNTNTGTWDPVPAPEPSHVPRVALHGQPNYRSDGRPVGNDTAGTGWTQHGRHVSNSSAGSNEYTTRDPAHRPSIDQSLNPAQAAYGHSHGALPIRPATGAANTTYGQYVAVDPSNGTQPRNPHPLNPQPRNPQPRNPQPRDPQATPRHIGPAPDPSAQAGPSIPSTRIRRAIRGTDGDTEELDERYHTRSRPWFKKFRVFMMLWHEPNSDMTSDVTRRNLTVDTKFGEGIYTKIRWFIIIRDGTDSCLCVPIVTYQGQGLRKGVKKSEHAVVHTSKTVPAIRPNEKAKGRERPMRTSIRVVPDEQGDILDEMSRIDYSRIYTVEKNVKARPFGQVIEGSRKDLEHDFLNVLMGEEGYKAWEAKYAKMQKRYKEMQNAYRKWQSEQGIAPAGPEDEKSEDSESDEETPTASCSSRQGTSEARYSTRPPVREGKAPARDPTVIRAQELGAAASAAYSQPYGSAPGPSGPRVVYSDDYRRRPPQQVRNPGGSQQASREPPRGQQGSAHPGDSSEESSEEDEKASSSRKGRR